MPLAKLVMHTSNVRSSITARVGNTKTINDTEAIAKNSSDAYFPVLFMMLAYTFGESHSIPSTADTIHYMSSTTLQTTPYMKKRFIQLFIVIGGWKQPKWVSIRKSELVL